MNTVVRDFTDRARDGKFNRRHPDIIKSIIVHRLGEKVGTTPEEVADSFLDTGKYKAGSYTGGQQPYHIWIDKEGVPYQLLRLEEIGWHALKWSKISIGIACCGDFRNEPPTSAQIASLTTVCLILTIWIGNSWKIFGHTELPLATLDTSKECPGGHLNIHQIRSSIRSLSDYLTPISKQAASNVLKAYGIRA